MFWKSFYADDIQSEIQVPPPPGGCKVFKSWSLLGFLNVGIFAKILEFFFFFLPQRMQIWQKRTLSWILSYFFVQKYIKFPIFQTCFARKQQFGGLFCRLGNLGDAMHPCTPPPWACLQHVLVIPYCTCTANPKLHKSDNCTKMQEAKLEFVYGGGGWVCECCSNLHFV